jgi:hypothetical protein
MTTVFTYETAPMRQIESAPTAIQRRILISFCVIVFAGMALSLLLISRSRSWSLPGASSSVAAPVWVVMSAPDPPAPAPLTASPYQPLKLDIFAIEDAWLEVETDGRITYTKLVRAEQALSFEATERIRILTGNASGVELRFNGQLVAPGVGNRHVRNLEFTTDGSRELNSRPVVAKT